MELAHAAATSDRYASHLVQAARTHEAAWLMLGSLAAAGAVEAERTFAALGPDLWNRTYYPSGA